MPDVMLQFIKRKTFFILVLSPLIFLIELASAENLSTYLLVDARVKISIPSAWVKIGANKLDKSHALRPKRQKSQTAIPQ
jgi:hypothetical protein